MNEQEAKGIKNGDTLKVMDRITKDSSGWGVFKCLSDMDHHRNMVVDTGAGSSTPCMDDGFCYPIEVLEIVKKQGVEMTEREKYIAGQKDSGIEVGDTVRVVQPNERHEGGSTAICHEQRHIDGANNVGCVRSIYNNEAMRHIKIITNGGMALDLPYFVLEIVKKANGDVPEAIAKTEITGECDMSTGTVQEQTVFEVTVVQRTEVLHEGSGVLQKINRKILFTGKVTAVGDESAKNQAYDAIKAETSPDVTLDYDKLETTCKPF